MSTLDGPTIAAISATLSVAGTIIVAMLGVRQARSAKRTDLQINENTQKIHTQGEVDLSDRQEAGRIRVEQREEIKELRGRLDLKDKQIDDLQDENRKLLTKIERLEILIESLQQQLSEASRTRERALDQLT